MYARPPDKTGELLTVNVKAQTEPVPAKKGAEYLIGTGEVQVSGTARIPITLGLTLRQFCS